MRGLTLTIHPFYAVPTTLNHVVGFDSSNTNGASAPIALGAFFTPKGFPFGGVHWEAFGLAGFRLFRSVNPMYAATLIFDRIGCRLLAIQQTDSPIMTTSNVFVLNESTSTQSLLYYALDASYNHKALALALSQLSEAQYDATQFYDQIHSLSCLLLSELQRQHVVLEKLYSREERA